MQIKSSDAEYSESVITLKIGAAAHGWRLSMGSAQEGWDASYAECLTNTRREFLQLK